MSQTLDDIASWGESPSGEPFEVIAKATGAELTRVAAATVEDVGAAVASAKEAQKAWAAQPYPARAAVMLKAAQILEAESERLMRRLVEEAGSGQGKAGFEVMLVTTELQESAAAASAPYVELLRSMKPRLSRGTCRSASSG